MTNCWFSESNNRTACGEAAGEMARHISVDDWSVVSCPRCLDADYPAISATDIELREYGKYFDSAKPDPINSPAHYTWLGGIEVIDITEHLGFCLGNVVKYVCRADHKGKPIEDLEKAQWYLAREIARRKR
jgi:hypothetical protein